MQNGAMKDWLESTFLAGENQSYIEDIYEDYLTDPNSVDESWREIFQQLPANQGVEQSHSQTRDYFRRLAKESTRYHTSVSDPAMDSKQVKVLYH